MSQSDIVQMFEYSYQQSYSRYETGAKLIPADRLIELARFYKVSVDYILELTYKKETYSNNTRR